MDLSASRLGVPLRLRNVRTQTLKMTLELDSGAGELYDLASDPHETRNLFDDPAYASSRRELAAMIASRSTTGLSAVLEPLGMA